MTQLYKILSPNQKKSLANAFHKREIIVLRLPHRALDGTDTFHGPATLVNKLEKSKQLRKRIGDQFYKNK